MEARVENGVHDGPFIVVLLLGLVSFALRRVEQRVVVEKSQAWLGSVRVP